MVKSHCIFNEAEDCLPDNLTEAKQNAIQIDKTRK
jgi:hypothetical protein